MFKASGYISAAEIRDRYYNFDALSEEVKKRQLIREKMNYLRTELFRQARRKFLHENPGPSVSTKPEPSREEILVTEDEAQVVSDFTVFPIVRRNYKRYFENFLRKFDLKLIGPEGRVISVGSEILDAMWVGSEFDKKLLFVSEKYFTVDLSDVNFAIDAAIALEKVGPIFNIGYVGENRLEYFLGLRGTVRALLPFEGWTLSVSLTDLAEAVKQPDMAESEAEVVKAAGRPRKVEAAAEAYHNRFPDGHGPYSLKEVMRILEVEEGVKVGEGTLRKAISSNPFTE